MVRYELDPDHSRFTVQAFATGFLSAFAHDPTFAVGRYGGFIGLGAGEVRTLGLELVVVADSLELLDRVKPADREEIEDRARREVLETQDYPEIVFRAAEVAISPSSTGYYRPRIDGQLMLHGLTRRHQLETELLIFEDGLRLRGLSPLRLSDYRIRPVTALGGAIKLKDEVMLAFDIGAVPETS